MYFLKFINCPLGKALRCGFTWCERVGFPYPVCVHSCTGLMLPLIYMYAVLCWGRGIWGEHLVNQCTRILHLWMGIRWESASKVSITRKLCLGEGDQRGGGSVTQISTSSETHSCLQCNTDRLALPMVTISNNNIILWLIVLMWAICIMSDLFMGCEIFC